ncbi:MAG: GNAT family N-acetyltransferase [Verrucomicrobia bacterium]|nr:GNAT family N-acetyltransferase [Verrucomicrobiota bacterium]
MSQPTLPMSSKLTDPKRPDVEWHISHEPSDKEWDGFVARDRESQCEQTSMWGEARAAFRWKAWRVIVRKEGRILGGAQCFEFKAKSIIKVGYICRGPVIEAGVEPEWIWDAILWAVRQRGILYVALSFPYWGDEILPSFLNRGGLPRPPQMPPAVWTQATSVIDLAPDEDALAEKVRKTTRKHIRRAERAGLTVVEGSSEDLERFNSLMLSLCRRRGVSPNVPGDTFVALLWSKLAPAGCCKLLLSKLNGETISSMLLITMGAWVRAWRIGWSGQEEKSFPNDLLYWESVLWAKRHGFRHFDMGGIDRRDADELAAGRPPEGSFHCSITFFKLGFGGNILRMPGEYCYFPNPALRFLFRTVGCRLLENQAVMRALLGLYSRLFPRSGG